MQKQKNTINGWLIINKPIGTNSTRVVSIIKRYFNAKKVGHAGTLDPLADGVLPIALGEATKTINYMMDSDKEYVFTVKWGEETSTCDREGEVIATSDKIPTEAEILAVLPGFVGEIDQTPPAYSAIKIDGKRAYDLARSGREVVMKSRKVRVYDLCMVSDKNSEGSFPLEGGRLGWGCAVRQEIAPHHPLPNPPPSRGRGQSESLAPTSTFRVKCGKGTYVRSLARDIAEKLGTKGHVTALKRTKVGKFAIEDAILLETFENSVYKASSDGLILPVDAVLDDIPVLAFTPSEAKDLRQGKKVNFDAQGLKIGTIAVIKAEKKLLALGEIGDGYIKAARVFNI